MVAVQVHATLDAVEVADDEAAAMHLAWQLEEAGARANQVRERIRRR
ncbi:hypothetical protein nbrc107696_08170 [Gordonia spumicola]|uniref:Uncharacterized protein n=1 Tax=Gordonia spumicola TaxID=589161 RepID=A0A7I9V5R1_9ACTN|nr:hypothetical protein nbrc107696_08170 [Gordonia spumicola]